MWFPMYRISGRTIAVGMALACSAVACRLDMHDAPRFDALEQTELWEDGRASRDPIPGTVARGRLKDDRPAFFTGKNPSGGYVNALPPEVEFGEALLARGKERFEVFCAPCHGVTGYGNGMIVQRGFQQPPSFHSSRLRESPLGYYFDVITNGYGAMYSYGAAVKTSDRWAIAAYLRTLQLSQAMTEGDLTSEEKAALSSGPDDGHGGEHGSGGHH
ncbi:MAG TPA: cytochrome c [Myxococcales bacterium LLY-WYZ-16_1]|jgi:mono/diheme cytochrome c family protein|nr:cytochrome c [Myxococcales bacterium LLY-WYZ-16_1]